MVSNMHKVCRVHVVSKVYKEAKLSWMCKEQMISRVYRVSRIHRSIGE